MVFDKEYHDEEERRQNRDEKRREHLNPDEIDEVE